MERLIESLHHREDHVLMVMFLDPGEVEISREPPPISKEHFPKAGASLEGHSLQNATLGQELKQEGQYHFLLRNHDVAKPGLRGVSLYLWLCQHVSCPS